MKRFAAVSIRLFFVVAILGLGLFPVRAQVIQDVYVDSLHNSWENWSWATVSLTSTAPVHSGSVAASVTVAAPWQAIYFHHTSFAASNFTGITFWAHGGTAGGQKLQVTAVTGGNPLPTSFNIPDLTTSWQQVTIPWASLGVASGASLDGFWIQDRTGAAQPTFHIDDVGLTGVPAPPTTAVTVNVDTLANRHPISPLIYGVAFASTSDLLGLNATLNRYGGNATTRYNWTCDCTSRAADWYFESIAESNVPGRWPDTFVQDSKAGGAQPMLTMPILDWVAKVGPNGEKLASFSVSKYGAQTGVDPFWSDAGTGVRTNGAFVTGNDKNDANTPNSIALQQSWMQHLLGKWGNSQSGGVKWFFLDNEHALWFSTHRDVQPVGSTMEEQFNRMRDYGAMIKAQDPNAVVLGPEEWGWTGYKYSGYDSWYAPQHNYTSYPDRAAHGDQDYSAWLLQQFRNYELANNKRLLDYFTLHIYPQGGETGDDVSNAMQKRRNRSTRALWDPNYVDETWINDKIQLIPRMKSWVAQNYPNTKIGITEYNWGAENHINGATTQADIYGILGREGVDLATRWTTPPAGSPTFNAMKMFRNYDGSGSGFGDTSVTANVPNPDEVSAFAASRSSDNALTVMVVNKITNNVATTVSLGSFQAAGPVQVWQLTSANQITRLADMTVANAAVTLDAPAQSITLLVIPSVALAAPTGLTVKKFSTTVMLSWTDNTPDEDGFVIERAPVGTGNFTEIIRTLPDRTFYRANKRFGSFIYRVRTLRGGTLSLPSNEVTVR